MAGWNATHTVVLLLGVGALALIGLWMAWLAYERHVNLRVSRELRREKMNLAKRHFGTGAYSEGGADALTDEAEAEAEDMMKSLAARKAARESARRRVV